MKKMNIYITPDKSSTLKPNKLFYNVRCAFGVYPRFPEVENINLLGYLQDNQFIMISGGDSGNMRYIEGYLDALDTELKDKIELAIADKLNSYKTVDERANAKLEVTINREGLEAWCDVEEMKA